MRLLLLVLGLASGGLVACAQSESVTGGGAGQAGGGAVGGFGGFGGFGGDGGPSGGNAGVPSGGIGGATGGTGGGQTGGAAGAGGATGGTAGTGATGGTSTGGTGGTATGGTGGGNCTPPVPGGQCDTFPQCGCGAGLACQVTTLATGSTQCVGAGQGKPYNPCTAPYDCVAGYACVGSACKAFCEKDPDCTSTGGACIQVQYDDGSGVSKPVPQMKVCTKKCLLQNPSADCGPSLGCYLDTSVNPYRTDCAAAGTATGAGACSSTTTTVCAPGYVCLTSGDCRKWCRVGFTTDCPTGKVCQGFAAPNQVFVDAVEYGVCTL
jgi:hypothetical protein